MTTVLDGPAPFVAFIGTGASMLPLRHSRRGRSSTISCWNVSPSGSGFATFGRVTQGGDVSRAIQALPANGQTLVTPVAIVRIIRH